MRKVDRRARSGKGRARDDQAGCADCLARMLRRTSMRKIAYCKTNALNWAAVGTIDAYQTQTSMLKPNATTALASASAMRRMPQLRLVQTMMLGARFSVTIFGR